MAFFCFRRSGWVVEFMTWETFSQVLLHRGVAGTVDVLSGEQIDCVFGGIDLSIQ